MKIEHGKKIRGFFAIGLFVVIWELVARLKLVDTLFISSPIEIINEGAKLFYSGFIFPHLLSSLGALLIALTVAILLGTVFGIAVGFYGKLYDFFNPYIVTLNALPIVAVTPLIILWFGFGYFSKVLVIFLMAVVPISIAAIDGTRSVNGELLGMARSFKISDFKMVRSIVFFNDLPYIFSGIRVAVGRGVIGLVVAEIFGYNQGLGYLIALYSSNYQTALLMFTIVLLLVSNFLLVWLVGILERSIIKWE